MTTETTGTIQYLYRDSGYSDLFEASDMDDAERESRETWQSQIEPNSKVDFECHGPDCELTLAWENLDASVPSGCNGIDCRYVTVQGPEPEPPECSWDDAADAPGSHTWGPESVSGGNGLDVFVTSVCTRCGWQRVESNIQAPGQGNQMDWIRMVEYTEPPL